jgi:hypothetical protein
MQEQSLSIQAITMAMMGRAMQMFDQPKSTADTSNIDTDNENSSKIKQMEKDMESMKGNLVDIKQEVQKNHDEVKALLLALLTANKS